MSHIVSKLVATADSIVAVSTPESDIEDRLSRIESGLILYGFAAHCANTDLGIVQGERWVDTRPSVKALIEAALIAAESYEPSYDWRYDGDPCEGCDENGCACVCGGLS